MYTIKQLAQLSGVTTRTLRFYEEKGLLTPMRKEGNDYRMYGEKEVDTLQQILFYRAMEVSIDEITRLMGVGMKGVGYDPLQVLEGHYQGLIQKRTQLEALIQNVEKTMMSLKGEITMTDQEKFEGFKDQLIQENEDKYGEEIREAYGEAIVSASNAKLKGLTQEQYKAVTALEEDIKMALKIAVAQGDPTSDEAKVLVEKHKAWLCYFWKEYSIEAHKGLADMYVADPRFSAYYEQVVEGGAEFLRAAIHG